MQAPDDSVLLEKLKAGDNNSFQTLYRFSFPSIASFVKRNMGDEADAEDTFQEAIIVLLQKIRQPGFTFTSTLKTYLYSISKNLWLKRLRRKKFVSHETSEQYQTQSEIFTAELKSEKTRAEKVHDWLAKITTNCQRILKAIFYYREPMETLMKRNGWKNRHVAANQQYKCIQQIKREKEKEEKS